MNLPDTDHLSVFQFPHSPRHERLVARMQASSDSVFATTVVSIEEQMRGWLERIHRLRDVRKQVVPYDQLAWFVEFWQRWQIVHLDLRAADLFNQLRKQKVRIGTMDLKIAAIALANNARLLSANLRDFRHVPGLRIENWLD